jgi:hypothetical protein
VARVAVPVAVSVDSRVDTGVLVTLDTLDDDGESADALLPNTAAVPVLRIPLEVREGLKAAVADEPRTMPEDEDPSPKLHPSDCEY